MNDAPRAFISFLLCEAKQAEERARSLRATAATIEAKNIEARRKSRKKRKRPFETDTPIKPQNTEFFQDNGDVVKKKTESNETKKDGIQMMTNQWGDLCEQQYKSDFHNGHGDTKKQK